MTSQDIGERSVNRDFREVRGAIEHSKQLVERMATESDFVEGVAAFPEKRFPRWSGKP